MSITSKSTQNMMSIEKFGWQTSKIAEIAKGTAGWTIVHLIDLISSPAFESFEQTQVIKPNFIISEG